LSVSLLHCSADRRYLHSFPTRRSSDLLSLLPKKLFRIRMSRNFGMKMLTMTNLSTECLIQLTKLGYDATPFNQILKHFHPEVAADRKSGSAGMPRPISYAVFCLKEKST